jgi:hypothetical protein
LGDKRLMKMPNNSNTIPKARMVRGTAAEAMEADMSIWTLMLMRARAWRRDVSNRERYEKK